MIEATVALGLALSLVTSLAAGAGTPAQASSAEPGLPAVLTFHLGDGRQRTPGLTLSFALPGMVFYECRHIVHREERRDREISITLVGVAAVKDERFCRLVKEPVPVVERITLPPTLGEYRIVFHNAGRSDTYKLLLRPEAVELEAEGHPQFTNSDDTGKLSRVGSRWLWVDFSFLTDDSRRKMTAKRDEVLGALAALGAKPFAPPPGRYLLDGFVRDFPRGPRAPGVDEEYLFEWSGDWLDLQKVANRYRNWSLVAVRTPVMQIWLSSRDNVISTVDGGLNVFVQEPEPPTARTPYDGEPHARVAP